MEKNNYTIKYSAAFINQFNSILKYLVYQLKNKIAADNFHNQSLFPQPNIITKKSTNIIISNNTRTNTLIIKLKNTLQIQISRNNSLSNFRRLIQKSSINNIKQLIKMHRIHNLCTQIINNKQINIQNKISKFRIILLQNL